ncbi:hypothetical protein BGZ95_002047 [Linnemannia exigua]|uniref:Mitochondrial genome maintenance protein MGM101 n=1 Tax=Linnemannia exigua TaxID=604196 RepID=A0AAD4D622_9FUNG|nr:hypothetical protein BGZ95_002047 [Linnemannia exigua]
MLLAQPFLNMRTMATKTYTIKAKDIGAATKAASATSSYYSKASTGAAAVTRATAARASTTNPALAVSSSSTTSVGSKSFSASPVSAAPAAYSPSFSPYSDDSAPSRVGGDNGQSTDNSSPFPNGATGLKDAAIGERSLEEGEDWTRSFSGMAIEPFEKDVAEILMNPLDADDIEIKPDGLLYLPEIKYRRILNRAFGPGGKYTRIRWGLAPRSEHSISPKNISREYALVCKGRFVSTARGEQAYFDADNLATASEGCKSNALMRCCKDLGIASELWDPAFIRKFKKQYCEEVFVEHAVTKKKKKLWKRKDQGDFDYPYSKAKF